MTDSTISKEDVASVLLGGFKSGALSIENVIEIAYETAADVTGQECVGTGPRDLRSEFLARVGKCIPAER